MRHVRPVYFMTLQLRGVAMGTILTVHGTFAHLQVPGSSAESESSTAYWWRADSPFITELKGLVRGADGDVNVEAFEWSGENSVRERRAAGHALYRKLLQLEDGNESYCVVAHSHGGSVVSAALLEAAAKRQKLSGLKRWMTIGTPFVELRRERFLFMRLPLLLKAMYVASFMLFMIFVGATIGRIFEGDINLDNGRQLWRLGISGLFAALPVIVFLLVVSFRERRSRYFNRPRVRERARDYFGKRWLALTHEDDEVVRGLGTLRGATLPIFDRQFAVPVLSLTAVFMLPMAYLLAIYSSDAMVGLAELLRTRVYNLDKLDVRAKTYEQARGKVRSMWEDIRDARKILDDTLAPLERQEAAKRTIATRRSALRDERKKLHAQYPDLPELQRGLRFQRRFLEKDGKLCEYGRLCGNGYNRALNAQLLLHVITDEVSSLLVDQEVRRSTVGRLATYLTPVILVPVVFGIIAVLWVLAVQVLAGLFSRAASKWLDGVTWKQIRRSAFGNDTDDEVAVGIATYPTWLGAEQRFLPMMVSSEITQCSNDATLRSIGRFRDAISELAFMEASRATTDKLLAYMNWNELIHTSYFCVPSFTRLIAIAIAQSEGFQAAGELADPQSRQRVAGWLDEMQQENKVAA